MDRQNGIIIDEVLKLECMKHSKLIAGFKGTSNTVTKVNIMADPDILNWVDKGELLLTTAYSFEKDNKELQKSLIKQCYQKGLAGIGIKISPYLDSLSSEVKDVANKLNFPIIDIYYATPFSDIMTPIFKEIFNRQTSLLQRLEKIHEDLMQVVLEGGQIKEIGQIIYKNVRNPVAICVGTPHEWFLNFDNVQDHTKEALHKNAQEFYKSDIRQWNEKKLHEKSELIQQKYLKRMVMPIIVKNNIYGHIFSWSACTPLGGFDLSVLETSSTTIALEILKQLSIREIENKYKSEFLDELLSLDKSRKQNALNKANNFNLKLDSSYVMIIARIEDKNKERLEFLEEVTNSLSSEIESFLYNSPYEVFMVNKIDSIHLILNLNNEYKCEKILKDFASNLNKLMIKRNKFYDFQIGIGRVYKGLSKIHKSYYDSIKAIEIGRILGESKITYFDNLGIYKILCQDVLKTELEEFYNTTIYPLVQYDLKRGTELIKTLEVYFQYNGNLRKISEELFTHYNTILYRIQRIQEITNLDLNSQKDRLNLDVALKIKKILN